MEDFLEAAAVEVEEGVGENVLSSRIELLSEVPQTSILSVELQEHE